MPTYEIANDVWAEKVCKGYRLMNPSKKDMNDNQIFNRLIEIAFNNMWRDFEWEMRKKIVAACDHEGAQRSYDMEICRKCGGHRSLQGHDDPDCIGFGGNRQWGPWTL